MANFTRKLQRITQVDQLVRALELAELTEARATFTVACYEAVYGPLAPDFFQEVQELIKDGNPKTKGEFYQQVYGAAKTVHVDREYAAVTRAMEAEGMEDPDAPQSDAQADAIRDMRAEPLTPAEVPSSTEDSE